jgi:hypothetical protein
MREDKFKPINNLFYGVLEQECNKINADFKNDVFCRIEAHFPPNDEPGWDAFCLNITCLLRRTEFEESDNVTLGIEVSDWNNDLTINADIAWGDPSGKLEYTVFEKPVEATPENLTILKDNLPKIVEKLRQVIRDVTNKA